jgi:hypothetical protein
LILFQVSSLLCAAVVFGGLIWTLFRRTEFIVRPSFIFLGFFWLQVQFASAINSSYIYTQLRAPWTYFVIVHLFPVAILVLIPMTFRSTAQRVSARIRGWSDHVQPGPLVGRTIVLLCTIWIVLACYLNFVPFHQTGLYALLFEPELADEFRERSMKLANLQWFNYIYAIMEKAIAPVTGAYIALVLSLLWSRSRFLLIPLAVLGLVAAILPTMIYGARGPAVMIVAAAAFALLATRTGRGTPWPFVAAFVVALVPAIATMALKSGSFAPRVLLFQLGNVLDRVVGRSFCDNVSHVAFVQQNGFHGVGAIEKLAPLFGAQPVDTLNKVGARLYDECRSYGFSFLQFGQDPLATKAEAEIEKLMTEIRALEMLRTAITQSDFEQQRRQLRAKLAGLEEEKAESTAALAKRRAELAVDLRKTVSAGASFVVLNYSMFGLWVVVPSLLFVMALDLLLFAYDRMPPEAAVVAIGASVVPILTLCFSLFTTVLVSKGLLAVPLVAWLATRLPNAWFTLTYWRESLQSVLFARPGR